MSHDFFNQTFPNILVGKTYILREQALKDSSAFFDYFSDPEVHRHILISIPKTLEDAKKEIIHCHQLFKKKQGVYWTLAKQSDDIMIGSIGIYTRTSSRAEIAYDLSKQYWQQGIMSQALKQVIDFCFRKTTIKQLEALTLKNNLASTKLLQNLGFSHGCSMKKYRYHAGIYYDIEKFILMENDKQ